MTDKEKLTALLTEFGVEWQEKEYGIKCGGYKQYAKVTGYHGFYALFQFDGNDNFVQMGVWE